MPIDQLSRGYTCTPLCGELVSDVAALINRYGQHHRGADLTTPAEMQHLLTAPTVDPACDTCVVRDGDGCVQAFGRVQTSEPFVALAAWAAVGPAAAGRGLERVLVERLVARAAEFVPRAPADTCVVVKWETLDADGQLRDALSDAGFAPVRRFLDMRIDFASPPARPVWADGIAVRTFEPGCDDRAAAAAAHEAFQDHWGYVPVSEAQRFESFRRNCLEADGFDPELFFLAVEGDTIVGCCLCHASFGGDARVGEIPQLSVRRPWRRRGIARALLLHAFGEFYRRGRRSVVLTVDADNLQDATRLYESVGMYLSHQSIAHEKTLCDGRDIRTQNA